MPQKKTEDIIIIIYITIYLKITQTSKTVHNFSIQTTIRQI